MHESRARSKRPYHGPVHPRSCDLRVPFNVGESALAAANRIGDFVGDGDVDADDLSLFMSALTGPGVPAPHPEAGDFDGDLDIDLADCGILQACLSGPADIADDACTD